MKKSKHQYQEEPLVVLHNGIRHEATYTVENGVVIVRYGMATIQGTPNRQLPHAEASLVFLHYLVEKDSLLFEKKDAGGDSKT